MWPAGPVCPRARRSRARPGSQPSSTATPAAPRATTAAAGSGQQSAAADGTRPDGRCLWTTSAASAPVTSQWWDAHSDAPVVGLSGHRRAGLAGRARRRWQCPGRPGVRCGSADLDDRRHTGSRAGAGGAAGVGPPSRRLPGGRGDPAALAALYAARLPRGASRRRRPPAVEDAAGCASSGSGSRCWHCGSSGLAGTGPAVGTAPASSCVVTDRTVDGVAVGSGRRTPVPQSAWATQRVSLRRDSRRLAGGGRPGPAGRMRAQRFAASPAATTSVTSWSRNS